MSLTFVTYAQLADNVTKFVAKLPRNIVGVIDIPRSGMLPAAILAQIYNVPLSTLDSFVETKQFRPGGRRNMDVPASGNVIVVDDSVYMGQAMRNAQDLWAKSGINSFSPIWTAVYGSKPMPRLKCRIFKTIPAPRYFAWNLMQHPDLCQAMSDIDGVICYDPDVRDDDGPIYSEWLDRAIPFHIPKVPVGALVSMRLEKWRKPTEDWMHKYNVKFGNLILCPSTTAGDRRKMNYGEFKGVKYRDSNYSLFIESDAKQAVDIARVGNKPVVCITNGVVYQ